jgi:hypothetical protein
MANTVQLRRSSTAGAIPTAAQIVSGELAVNDADGKLFLKKADGTVLQIPGFPTTWNSAASYNIDMGSMNVSGSQPVISFVMAANVVFDLGSM